MNKKFIDLVFDQFQYGGTKYASTSTKEATDELVEDFGWNWLVGTQAKYVKRYKNTRREKDLLKIGCYMYINWLKCGYHLSPLGTADIQCTTVDVKAKFFSKFTDLVQSWDIMATERERTLELMYEHLLKLRLERGQMVLLTVFCMCHYLWCLDGFDKVEEHETDTWNEQKGITRVKGDGKSNA